MLNLICRVRLAWLRIRRDIAYQEVRELCAAGRYGWLLTQDLDHIEDLTRAMSDLQRAQDEDYLSRRAMAKRGAQ